MKIKLLFFFFFSLISIFSFSQKLNLLNGIATIQNRYSGDISKGYISQLDQRGLNELMNNEYQHFISEIPSDEFGEIENFEFVQFKLLTEGFEVINSRNTIVDYHKGKYYSVVSGKTSKTGTFSFYNDKLMGIFGDQRGVNYNVGLLNNKGDNKYLIYRDSDIRDKLKIYCDTEDSSNINELESFNQKSISESSQKCINIYIEADYALYIENGSSISNTVDYVLGLFAESSYLYAREGINIKVSKIKVWDSKDSYSVETSHDALEQFRSLNSNSDVDLNMLLALGANGLGGVAYINALCNPNTHFAYANININYRNIPLYSWSVMVITHELGHNLGSRHTHACRWNGDNTQIDDCGNIYVYNSGGSPEGNSCFNPEAPIIPLDGGTIMSYCHLVGASGINLSKGFGQQPGDYIRNKVANAECIENCANFGDKKPVADFQAGNTLTCEDGDVTFYDKSINHPTEWLWIIETGDKNDTMFHKYPVMKYNTKGVFDVQLISSNSVGADTIKKMDFITVIDGPKAGFEFDYLEKDKVQFNNKSINSTSYFWRFGDGRISLLKNPKHRYRDGGMYLVELRAKKDSCSTENYFQDSVEIKIPYKAKFNYNKNSICEGDTIFFSVDENRFDSVQWSFQGGNISTSKEAKANVVYTEKGFYGVSIIAYSKYGSDTLISNDIIEVKGAPEGYFDFDLLSDSVVFENYVNGDSYLWNFGDGTISTDKNPIHYYEKSDTYAVILKSFNECDSSVFMKNVIYNKTSVNEVSGDEIVIYPNPASGILYINTLGLFGDADILIKDVYGKLVYYKPVYLPKAYNNPLPIKIDRTESGIYFLVIKNKEISIIKKVIFEN